MVQYPGNITRPASATLISYILASPAGAQNASFKIMVQEGQGAINNIPQHRAKEPVVQVQHEDGEPVACETVTPSGTFADGARMLNIQPDEKGQAVGRGLRPHELRRPQVRFGDVEGAVIISADDFLVARVPSGASSGAVVVSTKPS